MEILVTKMSGAPVSGGPMEIVERKGLGHPDSLCDGAAEALSFELSKFYLEKFGTILHHNVDKAVLVGGKSRAFFGGGEVINRMRLIFVGRATYGLGRVRVPVKDLAVRTGRDYFRRMLPHLDVDKHLKIDVQVRPGSADLVANYEKDGAVASNDTSLGVGFAPLTDTERVVMKVEQYLNSVSTQRRHPEWGQDIKVMGTRVGKRLNLTVALAFVAKHTPDFDFYMESRGEAATAVARHARKFTDLELDVNVNGADVLERRSVYLTVTGTSAEMGDDGQVGRGNRVNGLITPYRPMTLEAAAGTNPTTHVGKIYNFAAGDIAARLAEVDGIDDAHVYLVSSIGAPVNEPRAVEIRVWSGLKKRDLEKACREIAGSALRQTPTLWKSVLAGKYGVC